MTFEKYEKFAIFIAKVLELVFQVAVINTSTQVCVYVPGMWTKAPICTFKFVWLVKVN